MRAPGDLRLLRAVGDWTKPHRVHVAAILLVGLLATPLTLLTPVPLQIVVDCVLGSEPVPGWLADRLPAAATTSGSRVLFLATGLLLLVALLTQGQALASSILTTATGERLVLAVRARLFRQLQRLSLGYHDSSGTSDSIYRVQYDATAVQSLVLEGLLPLVTASFTLAGMLFVTFRLDWQLALVALAASPVLFLIARSFRSRVRGRARELKQLESSALSVVQEVLVGLRVVRAFGQEEREQQRFETRSSESMRARIRLALLEGGLGAALGLTVATGTGAVLFIGARNVAAGTLTLGELLLIMAYLAQLYRPLSTMGRKAASLQRHLAGVERLVAVLDLPPGVRERPGALPLERAAGEIVVDDVSFAYEEGAPVLRDVSFEIPVGARIGVVGETGSGKTTLVALITRFYDVDAGRITLDGVDLRDYQLADLRSQFAIVLQDPMLFSTTIAENISYADPTADRAAIVRAAQAARAHDFIERLPEGYDTVVGERGLRLSGGERQRIAIARAFLKDAPIVILDEPTSAIDMRTESGILEATERLTRGRTCIVIAHRESTLAGCDAVLVVHEGRIAPGDFPPFAKAVGDEAAG
jgi:ATP-binding cassette subfamily B protein